MRISQSTAAAVASVVSDSVRPHRAAAAAAAEAVHRYQKGCKQSGRITYVTVKHYFST